MNTWLNRGASGGPCGGLEERKPEPKAVRPNRSDSSQQASSIPGAVQLCVQPGCSIPIAIPPILTACRLLRQPPSVTQVAYGAPHMPRWLRCAAARMRESHPLRAKA
jgi:hypothetical protein